jgi:hypothetical protein
VVSDYLHPVQVQVGSGESFPVRFDIVSMDVPVTAMTQGDREALLNRIIPGPNSDSQFKDMGAGQILHSVARLTAEKCFSADLVSLAANIRNLC